MSSYPFPIWEVYKEFIKKKNRRSGLVTHNTQSGRYIILYLPLSRPKSLIYNLDYLGADAFPTTTPTVIFSRLHSFDMLIFQYLFLTPFSSVEALSIFKARLLTFVAKRHFLPSPLPPYSKPGQLVTRYTPRDAEPSILIG